MLFVEKTRIFGRDPPDGAEEVVPHLLRPERDVLLGPLVGGHHFQYSAHRHRRDGPLGIEKRPGASGGPRVDHLVHFQGR